MKTSLQQLAQFAWSLGANVLPIETGQKRPAGEWARWIAERQTPENFAALDWSQADRFGIVSGINGWRTFDVDDNADPFVIRTILDQLGLPLDYPWVEKSQSGTGYHLWVLCDEALTAFPAFADGQPGVVAGTLVAGGQLELRWQRNQTIVAGSALPENWLNGVPAAGPATVSAAAVAGAFLSVATPKDRKQRPAQFVGAAGSGDRPGDDFNTRGDIRPFLESHGWTCLDRIGEVEYWRRPGKSDGSASATLNYYPGLFYVFSSNAAPFSQNVGYSSFAVYSLLEHGADFAAASRTLRTLGYGRTPSLDGLTEAQVAVLQGAADRFRYSDYGNAECFTEVYGTGIRFDRKRRDGWLVWNGTAWREDERGAVEQQMLTMIRQRGQAAFTIRDDAQREDAAKWALRSESGKHYLEALARVKTMPGVVTVTTDYDRDPWLLTLNNATLDLRTGAQYDPRPEDLITKVAPVHLDPEADCPTWNRFISEIFEGDGELVRYVQKALGMCLSGDISEQAFFIAYGQGANGKSTLLNTVRRVLGDYAATTSFGTFDADSRNEYGNDIAALKGRRFVVAIEAEHSRKLAEARVKTITGGDEISCRFLYGEFFAYRPTYKVWLAVNHKPVVRGADHGIWRRIHLVPFNVRFGEGGKPVDRGLESKLTAEFPGIFNWLLEGFQQWRAEGLQRPDSVRLATEDYQQENDSVARFVAECCETGPNHKMEASVAYPAFRAWLQDQGEQARFIPNQTFWGHRMAEKGFQKTKNGHGRVEYRGIALRENTLDFAGYRTVAGSNVN